MIEVVHPGLLTTIQDLGRKGYEEYGVAPSGAFDPFLATVANKLVGNHPSETLLEFAYTGPYLRFFQDCWVAFAGFSIQYTLEGKQAPPFAAFRARAGTFLEFQNMTGWFGYLAIGGSFQTQQVLGSSSTYLAGRIGGRLERGAHLIVKEDSGKHFSIKKELLGFRTTNVVDILPALHTSRFSDRELQKLADDEYRISTQSNRMGIHLEGTPIETISVRRSVPTLAGTLQVLRSGMPIILGPEGPTTGGYPQLAILSRVSWTKLAELRPGRPIRFQWTDVDQARRQWRFRQRILDTPEAWYEVRS